MTREQMMHLRLLAADIAIEAVNLENPGTRQLVAHLYACYERMTLDLGFVPVSIGLARRFRY